jgi:proteasome accessory factor C
MQYLLEEDRPDFVTWQTLESDLGLTRTEAEADISLINLVNFGGGTSVIYAENTADGVRVTRDPMADVFSQPAQLSPLMVRALSLAFDLLGDGAAIDSSGSLASARRKIIQLADGIPAKPPIIVDEVGWLSPAVFELLSLCVQNHCLVEIEYFTPAKGKLTKRKVEPYLLFRTGEGWYLEAFCLLAGEQRTFRLEFIREVTPTSEVFIPRAGADLASRRAGRPLASNSAQWASVVFAPRWITYLEDRGISYDMLQDGWLRARLPYFAEEWLVREVLRFLGEAVLSEPESVRHHIREVAAGLRELYSTQG